MAEGAKKQDPNQESEQAGSKVISEGEQNLPEADITAQSYDAEQIQEAVAEGEAESPRVDLDADYAAAQQMSQGAKSSASAATSMGNPQFEQSHQESAKAVADSTGNPDDYRDMAKDVTHAPTETGDVSDDVMQRSSQKGQAQK
ncbi:hypothetical protein ACN4EK_21250 [Pantanalinema rosaneae CENA516]|uniref:hypothetical protein n=1 Tax=Pantanalinema rosaneae TaxID=1620701 RepID=UPI003D6DBD39